LHSIEGSWVLSRVAEEFEEGGWKEGVGEFDGVAAGAAQLVRLLQSPREPPLLGQARKRNLNFLKIVTVDGVKGGTLSLGGKARLVVPKEIEEEASVQSSASSQGCEASTDAALFFRQVCRPHRSTDRYQNVSLLGDTRRLVAENANRGIYLAEVSLTLKKRQAIAGCVVARPWWALTHHDDAGFTK
jgi:hypothetical protein